MAQLNFKQGSIVVVAHPTKKDFDIIANIAVMHDDNYFIAFDMVKLDDLSTVKGRFGGIQFGNSAVKQVLKF